MEPLLSDAYTSNVILQLLCYVYRSSCLSIDHKAVNTTIEERVAILELQVTELTDDVDAVEDEVTIITSGQIAQDQRILELEIDSDSKGLRYIYIH